MFWQRLLLTAVLMTGLAARAGAWWDTRLITRKPIPLVREFPAAALPGVPPAAIVQDAQANGGQGGQVVTLAPGGAKLQVELELKRSIYCLWAIARTTQAFDAKTRPPAFFTLTVTPADGMPRQWTMPVAYLNTYEAVAQMYFPVYAPGKYTAAFTLDPQSQVSFLVDRLELRDALANTARVAAKTRRMLTTDAELAQIRQAAAARTDKRRTFAPWNSPVFWGGNGDMPARTPEQRREYAEKIWAALPDFNATVSFNTTPYQWMIGHDAAGAPIDGGRLYEEYGDREAAWNGAVILCGLAERYPALDRRVQEMSILNDSNRYGWGDNFYGKFVYSGWATPALKKLAIAYDQLFDFIKDNQELATFLGTKIPWVKTPHDVIELIDTNILQAGMDAWHRRQLEGADIASAYVPLVQGVNDVSRRMLEENLFATVDLGEADSGGINDQIFSSYNRDGVRYIGAVGYIDNELADIARVMHLYVQAGGDKKYDLLDEQRYPHLTRANYSIEATSVAGGFPLILGDSRDLHVGRINAQFPSYPSRVLGGFGVAILEDGQGPQNVAQKRAVAIRTGLGAGHAHQDILNLDITALGCRLASDLGGRHENTNTGSPNMRWNKVHNVVEVDNRNFENTAGGTTTTGTGWTRAFSPSPGCQVAIASARATSHPQVSLYERTTAMIDGPLTDNLAPIYVFDVFRVAGGKTHTFCFHGAESDDFQINTPLQPATSEFAVPYLQKHKEGTRQQGSAPAVLEADWRLRGDMQQAWLGTMDENARRHTRLSLLGEAGADVFVGNATSNAYHYDFPFLYLQKRSEKDLSSAFVSIVETYAGAPFIQSKRRLAVRNNDGDARAAVAAEVKLADGRHDIVFADGHPERIRDVEGGLTVAGEFGFYSEDKDGLCQMHLLGGTQLQMGEIGIRAQVPRYSGKLTAVDYDRRSFIIDAKVPPRAIASEVAVVGSAEHPAEFNLKGAVAIAGGTRIECVETPQFYQSRIMAFDAHTVVPELEPGGFRSDSHYYEGAIVTNETHTKFWPAHLVSDERWMHINWPGYRTSVPDAIHLADVPDADHDGKRTLRMISSTRPGEATGKPLLTLEVTRVDEPRATFYFKMPDDPQYQIGGWQFVNGETPFQNLVNEDGSKVWRSLYPGTSYRFALAGPPLRETDFPDADRDGRRKLLIYHYGPGSDFTLPTHVAVRRVKADRYEIRSNVPCTITLPGKGKWMRVVDGTLQPLKTSPSGAGTALHIGNDLLTGEPLVVRCVS